MWQVAVLLDDGARRLLIVKGAPEEIIAHCTEYEYGGETHIETLDETVRESLHARFHALEEDGLRVIAIAWREAPRTQEHALIDDEEGLIFAGFAAFFDPPRAEAGEAVAALAHAGIAVKIVTGDHEGVARHVCRETGIPVTGTLTGTQMAALDDLALSVQLESVNLICRVSPAQKSRVITLLRHGGHAVGFMGDGINDAPALRAADVGISVDTGVDVAKEAADVILLKHDLRVLLDGVREGRRAQSNVLKYVMMATSSNFGNMASVAAGAALLPFLPMLPIQILLNNLLYDISEFAIPFDITDDEELSRPRPWDIALIRNFMLTVGPVSSLFDLLTFYVMLNLFAANEALFRTGWFVESLATQVLVIFVIRTRRNAFASRPATGLIVTSLAVVALALWLHPPRPACRACALRDKNARPRRPPAACGYRRSPPSRSHSAPSCAAARRAAAVRRSGAAGNHRIHGAGCRSSRRAGNVFPLRPRRSGRCESRRSAASRGPGRNRCGRVQGHRSPRA